MLPSAASSSSRSSSGSSSIIIWDPSQTLVTFSEMWYQIFLWAVFSSLLVHAMAAVIGVLTLRKHRLGKFFTMFVVVMGVVTPVTCGAVTSVTIAFVYKTASLPMTCLHAMLWGTGQTVGTICISFTRVLATL